MKTIYLIGMLLALMVLAAPAAALTSEDPTEGGIIPTCVSGNDPEPSEACGNTYFKLKPAWGETGWTWVPDGNAPNVNPYGLTLVTEDGILVSWSVTGGTFAGEIRVKGGDGYCTYTYPEAGKWTGDSGLHSPVNPSGGYAAISHVSVCGNFIPDEEELTVTKTAVTTYTRTHDWSIDKSVGTENGYTHDGFPKVWLYIDGSGDETATWTVDVAYEGYAESGHNVAGAITIENTGSTDAIITDIDDLLAGTAISLDCGVTFPYTLPAGETLTCTYSEDGYVEGCNEVTVTTERDTYYASAPIVWGDPTIEVNKEVTIKDISDLFGEVCLGTATAPYNQQFTYSKCFAWADYGKDNCGDFVYGNTASIVETGESADATLKVNVQCYLYETAYARGCSANCFIPTFSNWGWTNPIEPGTYTWDLWAGAGQCDTSRGTLVGTVTVIYGADGYVAVTYNVASPNSLEETHVYAGYSQFPLRKGTPTVAPGAYTNNGPFDGEIYVIAHAVVGIPDPDFGP